MPIYTYQCDNCGVRFERHQNFNDPALTRCPECSKKTLRKIFTPVGIVFKGSGFYATDHRSPSGNRANGGAGSPGGAGNTGAAPDGGTKSEGEDKRSAKSETSSKAEASAKES
jgi:putative FmdB family regulatory protein